MSLPTLTNAEADRLNNASRLFQILQVGTRLQEAQGSAATEFDTLKAELDALLAIPFVPFIRRTVTLTSAAAAAGVTLLLDADVGGTRKAYLVGGWHAKVNGSTAWATTATVAVQDTSGSPVPLLTFAVAGLTANRVLVPGGANVTHEDAYILGTGCGLGKGVKIIGNANGTGSDLVFTGIFALETP